MEDTGLTSRRDPPPVDGRESREARVTRLLAGRTIAMVGMMGAGK